MRKKEKNIKKKNKMRKQVHRGEPVYEDDEGRMFVKSGNANVYLKSTTVRKIKARKKKKEPEQTEEPASKESFVFHRKLCK